MQLIFLGKMGLAEQIRARGKRGGGGGGGGGNTHYRCCSLDTAEQIGVRRKLGWRRGWGAGGGRSMDHLCAVWTRQYQVGMLCVLFPCLLCSERKIIAFISSVFLKLFDIKIIFFLLGE